MKEGKMETVSSLKIYDPLGDCRQTRQKPSPRVGAGCLNLSAKPEQEKGSQPAFLFQTLPETLTEHSETAHFCGFLHVSLLLSTAPCPALQSWHKRGQWCFT